MEIPHIFMFLLYLVSTVSYGMYFYMQKDILQQSGFGFLSAGFLCQSIEMGYRYIKTGVFPAGSLYHTLLIVSWAVAGLFLIFRLRVHLKVLGTLIAPLVLLIFGAALFTPDNPYPPNPLLNNIWLVIHVITLFVGDAAFAMACGLGILYLIQEKTIKQKHKGFFFKRLPSLSLLDSTGYLAIVTGFLMLTLGLITGLIYAKAAWGHFWSWDPKEVWSAITWLLYAALLHARLTSGWHGRRSAMMAIIGFGVMLFTFLGVNLFIEGHHKVFTRW